MKTDTIITLGDKYRFYLIDETIQDGKKYFLGTEVDEEENPKENSEIFEEIKEADGTYLTPVIDEEMYNYLAAIFVAKFNKTIEESE